jgi:SAM-dependent methyltransferase
LKTRIEEVKRAYRKIKYPFLLVDQARQAAGRAGETDATYGSTPPALALKLLKLAGAGPEDTFYDLGCGLGAPAIVAALICKKAVGVEMLPGLVRYAQQVAEELGLVNASFIEADFGAVDVSDATVIYSYSTCFSARNRAALSECAARARPGARVLSVTHDLQNAALELVERREVRFEDSNRTVFLHRRR